LILQSFRFDRYFLHSAMWICGVAIAAAFGSAAILGFYEAAIENGPMEHMSELLLLAAAYYFGRAAINSTDADRMAALGAMTLSLLFFFRELELPVTGPITAYLDSNTFRWHETIVVLAVFIPYFAMRWRLIPEILRFLLTSHVLPFIGVLAFLLCGDLFDQIKPAAENINLFMFIEEMFEFVAYTLFALSAHRVARNAKQQSKTLLHATA
jgi:hypothetical protein